MLQVYSTPIKEEEQRRTTLHMVEEHQNISSDIKEACHQRSNTLVKGLALTENSNKLIIVRVLKNKTFAFHQASCKTASKFSNNHP